MLELYHYNLSVCSQKVRLCLAEKMLDWTGHHVDLMRFENVAPEYLRLNPNGVVPTLVHDGRVVIESSIINEYLDDSFDGPSLRPMDPFERARMRLWIKREDDAALPAVGVLTLQKLIKPQMQQLDDTALKDMAEKHPDATRAEVHELVAHGDIPQAALDAAEGQLEALLDDLEAELTDGGPWLAGGSYSLADLTWTPFLDRMLLLGLGGLLEPSERPGVADWYTRVRDRPSYDSAIQAFFNLP